jgi:antitoxin HigA-1
MRSAAKTTTKAPALDELREPPTNPCEMPVEEFVKPKGVTQVEAARHLVIWTTCLNEMSGGKRGISVDSARRLGNWRETGPVFWMDLMTKWALWHAREARRAA